MTTSGSLGFIRAAAAQWLADRCTIEREELTEDAFGGQTRQWVTAALDVPCRLIKRGLGVAAVVASQDTISDMYKLALLANGAGAQVIDVDQRVTIADVVYQVTGIEAALTDGVFVMCVVQRKR